MANPSLCSWGLYFVTGLLLGPDEGYLSLGLEIMNPPPPCRETAQLGWVEMESMVTGIGLRNAENGNQFWSEAER